MKTVDQTMEQLDNTLDLVEELVRELPISDLNKRALISKVYGFWMDIESVVEIELSVDNTTEPC